MGPVASRCEDAVKSVAEMPKGLAPLILVWMSVLGYTLYKGGAAKGGLKNFFGQIKIFLKKI